MLAFSSSHPDRAMPMCVWLKRRLAVFGSRLMPFIIGLSCPSSALAQGATFEERKHEILTAIVNSGLPTRTSDPSRIGDAMLQKAVAHFALNQNTEAIAQVNAALVDGSGAMFHMYMLMYNYLKYGDRMDQTLKDKIKTRMTTYGGGITGSTQNHSLMYAAAFTLARETWPDATFAHALGYGPADPDGKQMIINGMKNYVTKGCEEADSYFYTVFYLNTYAMIHEFSKDKGFANMAKLTCDWFLLGAANNWLKGYMISPDNRTADGYWGANECPQDPGMSSVCYYLYFGAGQPFNFKPNTTVNNKGTVGGNNPYRKSALNCVSSYVCPDYIVKIAQNRKSEYAAKETHIKDGPMGARRGLYRTTYMTPTWGITGQKDVSYGDYYQKQMNRSFVRWISAEPYSTFNLYMPNFERSLAEGFGRIKYEQIMQQRHTVIGVTRAPADYKYPFVHALIPKASIKATLEDSGWLFLNAEKVVIAVKFARPYHWTEETPLFKSLQSDGPVNGYILETADATKYPGATPAAQLVNFKNEIMMKTVPDFSKIDTAPAAPTVSYKNLDGDLMTLTFSEARDENHMLNGKKVDYYGTWPLIDNPWAHQDEGKPLLNINSDGVLTTYNFDAWSRSSDDTKADLHLTDITFSQTIPTVNFGMSFAATIKNSGGSPSSPCSVKFSVKMANGSVAVVSTGKVGAIAAGSSATVTSDVFTPKACELNTIIVEADVENIVSEIEENNNNSSKTFLVDRNDLALEKTVTSSSGNARFANDRDAYSYWQSTALPATITVDLGDAVPLKEVKLSENPSWATPRTLTLVVLTSPDGITYTPATASKTYSIRGNAPAIIDLGNTTSRFVRLEISACAPNGLAEIARFQVYGNTAGTSLRTTATLSP